MKTFGKSKKDNTRRTLSKKEEPAKKRELLEPTRVLKITLFLTYCFLVVLFCFVGQFPAGLQVLPNQVAKIRIVADFPFTYKSQVLAKNREETLRKQIAPIYTIENAHYDKFEETIAALNEDLNSLSTSIQNKTPAERNILAEQFSNSFEAGHSLYINRDDVLLILEKTNAPKRKQTFDEGLSYMRDIMREGVFQPIETDTGAQQKTPFFYSVEIYGNNSDANVQTVKDSLRSLNLNISALDIDWATSRAFYRIFKTGVKPNLIFDKEKTEQKIDDVLASLDPINVDVSIGQTIIEPGSFIGPEQIEQLRAYHEFLIKNDNASFGFNITLRERSLLTLIILITAILYIYIALPKIAKSNRRISLLALTLLGNLAIIRIIFEISETPIATFFPSILGILPFCAPFIIAPMIIGIMLGPRPGILMAALVATFYSLMLGSITSFFLASLLSSFCAIFLAHNRRNRTKVVHSGILAGLAFATAAFFLGIFYGSTLNTVIAQVLFTLITGTLAGITVISILPHLERLFGITTNITLLELSDFNHPLLKRLQLNAPGTYHHSIMIATLSERAADKIGANPLTCRVCSLYHDIGKMIKPEYFVENQHEGLNPHFDRNPSMSALVIKSHISEGVALAKEYKLPKIIIDVIEQHHGTTLIQYFYDKALKKHTEAELPLAEITTSYDDESQVDESTFRYEGPVPQFKESAIISLADPIEAASRTLKKVTASGLDELIDNIVEERIKSNQLDECPLTFLEIAEIKKSFSFTLLNMLHSRIEYPGKDKKSQSPQPNQAPAPANSHSNE